MRLFLALNFNDRFKADLLEEIAQLQAQSLSGNLTRKDNLHLTLAFIGETSRLAEAKAALQAINAERFILSSVGFGCFCRAGGDIYWRGIKSNSTLQKIYFQVTEALKNRGFLLESRPFKPHLTLGRQVVTEPDFDDDAFGKALPELNTPINRVSLMKSERLNGKLKYREIAGVDLK